MVECKSEECASENGDKDEVGVDNRAVDLECDSDSAISETISEDDNCCSYSDLASDGNAVELAAVESNDKAHFGNVAVKNSTDIHFGNKTFYHGPVTIKQFVYATAADGDQSDLKDREKKTAELIDRQLEVIASDTDKKERVAQLPNGFPKDGEKPRKTKVPLRVLAVSMTLTLSLITAVVILIAVLSLNKTKFKDDSSSPTAPNLAEGNEFEDIPSNTNYGTDFNLSGKLRILSRKQWLAQPPTKKPELLTLPVPYVIISHTASDNCTSQSECIFIVRTAQSFHIDSCGWADIAYNFLVGGDGYAYEGRGWNTVGAHTFGYNVCSIGISFIGTFVNLHPPERQMLAAQQLIQMGVELGKIRSDYRLIAHRQGSATESPGQVLFDEIKTHPHWVKTPVICKEVQ